MTLMECQKQNRELINIKYKLIFEPRVARYLLKCGHVIYDIKPNKNNSERTIFVFKLTEKLKDDLASV